MWFTTQGGEVPLIELGRQDEPGPSPGMPCPGCQEDLLVSTSQDTFVLLCRCGRQISVEELQSDLLPNLSAGLAALLGVWEERLDSLKSLCADAQHNGVLSVSAVLDRHIRNLQARLEKLESIAKPASARLLPH
jgi:hypothetical protein